MTLACNSKSQTQYFEGIKATELTKRIHSKVLEKDDFNNVQKSDLNKSIKCFISKASLKVEEVNEAFHERSSKAARPTFYTSLLQIGSVLLKQWRFWSRQRYKLPCSGQIKDGTQWHEMISFCKSRIGMAALEKIRVTCSGSLAKALNTVGNSGTKL